ncbi:S9 family peptidase [Capnocytophaga canis]|uniref:S9 family peptidase n=1 Tax=Capnocytophaga canis TaxID=1848903 RepID=UPI001561CD88|nr:S9 family peptidase [Capnocytophaga canis]
MKLKTLLTSFILGISFAGLFAQTSITLEDIWAKGVLYPQRMAHLSAMKNTNQYTVLNYDRQSNSQQIDLYDFATLKKVKTIFDTKNFQLEIKSISDYSFDKNESKILIATNTQSIYRHSFIADFYVYDIKNQTLQRVSDKKIQEPVFSPDGKSVFFVAENNIYHFDLQSKSETAITLDGAKNKIINGITDWVYEEEFSFVRAFDVSKNGDYLAYIRFDEREVPEFSMDVYGNELYPQQQVFKYPKAGENNSKVSLHIYHLKTKNTVEIPLDAYYIPRIQWTQENDILSVQTMNRHQNHLKLQFINASNQLIKTILEEKDKAYIDITDNLTFLYDNSFVWTSEKDGFNHIYHYDKNGNLKKQITKGNWEVTEYYGYDPRSRRIFYQSTENGSINRGVYSIDLGGKNKKALSAERGMNKATFSPDFSLYINQFSSATEPPIYTLNDSQKGKQVKEILNNKSLKNNIKQFGFSDKEFTEITNEKGDKLNAWIIKPADFDPNKKYPLLMYQYSGPGSQQVNNVWHSSNDYWHYLLAQKGYIIVCVDGRGTGYKGADFKKCTYKELGKYEVEDQIFVARFFAEQPYIDKTRIGIWGWSFGGFMSSNCLFQGADVFKTAIAVAPVTSWRFYDTIYTERFMQTPQENPSGYDQNSPITHAQKLKGNYLLIHGTADDNVHVQNAMVLINQLVHLNKDFDWLIYPDKDHGIYGGYTRLQLYKKMTDYILEKL